MAYHVEIADRAERDLDEITKYISADTSIPARPWFAGLEALISALDLNPARGTITRETPRSRELGYGKRPHAYRVIYEIDAGSQTVTVMHIRHGARAKFTRADLI